MNFLPTNPMLFVNTNTYQHDSDMHNYIRTVAWTYSMTADRMCQAGNFKAMYACNKMATHYSILLKHVA